MLYKSAVRLYSHMAGLILSDFVNSQNNVYRIIGSPHAVDKVPLNDLKVWICWVIGTWMITSSVFFHEKF
jgi:hypothetical protein